MTESNKKPRSSRQTLGRVALLLLLYLVQGLPFGFQVKTLPVLLHRDGVSLTKVSLVGFLSLPWAFKLLWAPFVDSLRVESFGRRKTWIVPSLVVILAVVGVCSTVDELGMRLVGLLIMNLAASIQDVATDGLAIDILKGDAAVAFGNTAQVVGFKVGMLVTGGLVPWLLPETPWNATFAVIALIVSVALVALLLFDENAARRDTHEVVQQQQQQQQQRQQQQQEDTASTASPLPSPEKRKDPFMRRAINIISSVLRKFVQPTYRPLILLLLTYKTGELMADVMFKPFLLDEGLNLEEIALWTGIVGTLISAAGSILGGFLFGMVGEGRALLFCGVLRLVPQAGRFALSALGVAGHFPLIMATIAAESLTGGAMTTAVFSVMMSMTPGDGEGTATFYTGLTMIEILGKNISAGLAGAVAQTLGYKYFFATTLLLSALPLVFVAKLQNGGLPATKTTTKASLKQS